MKPFKEHFQKAEKIIKDKTKVLDTANAAMTIAEKNKFRMKEIWNQLQLLFSIVKDYSKGNYTAVPKNTIIAIIAGLLYLIVPLDAVPDFIPFVGYLDDVSVLSFLISRISKDLKKYEAWKKNQAEVVE